MQGFLFSIGGFILAIGILVAVHEYGHFLAARLCNVKVLRFSIGFGKSLWSNVSGKDNTEYLIAVIPLGGYVKMLDESEGEVIEAEKNRAFNNQSLVKRSFIVTAGPLANFILAVFIYTVINLIGEQGLDPVIESVKEDSFAEQAGFQAGDKILSIDGARQYHWDDNRLYLFNQALNKNIVDFKIESLSGDISIKSLDLSLVDNWQPNQMLLETTLGIYPFDFNVEAIVGTVLDDSPAARAGIKIDDRIVSIDNHPINNWQDLVKYITARPNQQIITEIQKTDGSRINLSVFVEGKKVEGREIGRIGIGYKSFNIPQEKIIDVQYQLIPAIVKALDNTWQLSRLTLHMLWKMLKTEISPKNISGPITIAEYAGKTVQAGLNSFLQFLAVISVSLGIINLLPIPILDGGHLLMFLGEAVKGAPLSDKVIMTGQKLGVFILGALMFLAFYNDLVRLVN